MTDVPATMAELLERLECCPEIIGARMVGKGNNRAGKLHLIAWAALRYIVALSKHDATHDPDRYADAWTVVRQAERDFREALKQLLGGE